VSGKAKLAVGTRVWWEGEAWTVSAFLGAEIEIVGKSGKKARLTLVALAGSEDFRVLDGGVGRDPAREREVFLESLPRAERRRVLERERHVLEVETGFTRGHAELALDGEPREPYDAELFSLTQRVNHKAGELKVGARTVQRWRRGYRDRQLAGLVDERSKPFVVPFARVDDRVKDALRRVLDELTEASNTTKARLMGRTQRILKRECPDSPVPFPSSKTFNGLVEYLDAGRHSFASAKSRRSVANRPDAPYRRFSATRPGEIVLMDSTPLDAYALDPVSFRWVQVHLSIALDLYTRSLLAWRFTPTSVKGVDAVLVLRDVIRPKAMRKGWPESARWPFVGVPEHVVIELLDDDEIARGVAGIPVVKPESVWVDRGKVYISRAFKNACARLAIDLQLARPLRPTDKAHVERMFRTMREQFVSELPGYKGPDVYSRGKDVEDKAFYFIDEIEELFATWVATYWQRRPHRGAEMPGVPKLRPSPNDLYEEGIMRAGFLHVVPDPDLYFEMLETEWRKIQHYGINCHGLIYDGEALNEFRDVPSPYAGEDVNGKYPIRFDPRDLSEVYFYDPDLGKWCVIPRAGAGPVNRPFDDKTLSYAKSLVIRRGPGKRYGKALEETLNELLDRMDATALDGMKERKLAGHRAIRTMQAELDKRRAGVKIADRALEAPDGEADLSEFSFWTDGEEALDLPAGAAGEFTAGAGVDADAGDEGGEAATAFMPDVSEEDYEL